MAYNPERRAWRGRSYKKGGRYRFYRVRDLRAAVDFKLAFQD